MRGPKFGTPGWRKRMHVHRHNGFTGSVRMMEAMLRNIQQAPSTTGEAKKLAQILEGHIPALLSALKTRIDP